VAAHVITKMDLGEFLQSAAVRLAVPHRPTAVICAVGAISNVGAAAWVYDYQQNWWLAGLGGSSGGHAEGRMPENHHDCVFIWRAVASHCE
jgi:hypothetical protein